MEVEAHIYYWSPFGMVFNPKGATQQGWIMRHEVERLLEEAHARGKRAGLESAAEVVKNTR